MGLSIERAGGAHAEREGLAKGAACVHLRRRAAPRQGARLARAALFAPVLLRVGCWPVMAAGACTLVRDAVRLSVGCFSARRRVTESVVVCAAPCWGARAWVWWRCSQAHCRREGARDRACKPHCACVRRASACLVVGRRGCRPTLFACAIIAPPPPAGGGARCKSIDRTERVTGSAAARDTPPLLRHTEQPPRSRGAASLSGAPASQRGARSLPPARPFAPAWTHSEFEGPAQQCLFTGRRHRPALVDAAMPRLGEKPAPLRTVLRARSSAPGAARPSSPRRARGAGSPGRGRPAACAAGSPARPAPRP